MWQTGGGGWLSDPSSEEAQEGQLETQAGWGLSTVAAQPERPEGQEPPRTLEFEALKGIRNQAEERIQEINEEIKARIAELLKEKETQKYQAFWAQSNLENLCLRTSQGHKFVPCPQCGDLEAWGPINYPHIHPCPICARDLGDLRESTPDSQTGWRGGPQPHRICIDCGRVEYQAGTRGWGNVPVYKSFFQEDYQRRQPPEGWRPPEFLPPGYIDPSGAARN